MKCLNCQNEVSPEWKRCPYCEYKPKLCSKEGCQVGWLPTEAHFCPLCGSPVKGEENLRLKEIVEKAIAEVEPIVPSDYSDNSSGSSEWSFTIDGVSFKMILVEGGTFQMGDISRESDERLVHTVTLSDYYIGETQVTEELWQAVQGDNPLYFNGSQEPAESVSWNDCQEFIKKLNQKTGRKFRLPSEAEWEFAARGGKKSKGFEYSGSNHLNYVAWYARNSGCYPHPVKQKAANELGLYDMSGNVWEWCQDWFGDYRRESQTNPTGPVSGSGRVLRGGSWDDNASYCRSPFRRFCPPYLACREFGFRLALSV